MYDNYGYSYNYDYTTYDTTSSMLGGLAAVFGTIMIISLIIGIIGLVSQWIIYKKAGKHGWECLIPIYNIIVLLQIVELPMWYIALFFVPIANIYAIFKIYIELAHKFGKSTGFGIATVFFSIICLPILAFGKNNVYNGTNNTINQINNQPNNPNNNINNFETSNNISNSNTQEPITFNPSMNTEINQINSVSTQETNTLSNSTQPIVFNLNQENQNTQPLNVIPNVEITPNIIENTKVNNLDGQVNSSETSSSLFENQTANSFPNAPSNFSNLNQSENNILNSSVNTTPEINVLPNIENVSQTVDINSNYNLNNQRQEQPLSNTPFEYTTQPSVTNFQPESPAPISFTPNQNIQNEQTTEKLNVIPNMGINSTSQMPTSDSNNNQNI